MKSIFLILFSLIVLVGCGIDQKRFWYPIVLKEVTCSTFKGEVYLMTHTRLWRSWPYYLDPTDKREIELGSDCTMKVIRRLPIHKLSLYEKGKIQIETLLTDEQRQFMIEGEIE